MYHQLIDLFIDYYSTSNEQYFFGHVSIGNQF